MTKKIGRNSLCLCGSGKKYKKCCLNKAETTSLTRSIMVKKSDELIPKLLEYAKQQDEDEIYDAWEEFDSSDDEEFSFHDSPYVTFFIPWYLFLWEPDFVDSDQSDPVYPSPDTVGARYLKDHRLQLDSLSIRYIEAALNEPLSFWQVQDIEPEKGVYIRNLFTDQKRFIEDISASATMHKWDIIFGCIMEMNGVYTINMFAPFALPSNVEPVIREQTSMWFEGLSKDDIRKALFEYDLDLIYFYQDIVDELFSGVPELRNMDGKELIFTTSTYEFDPADRKNLINILSTLEGLHELDGPSPHRHNFIWEDKPDSSSPMEIVTKGRIEVRKKYLETECNSAERDNQLRKKLLEKLDGLLTHRKTESKPVDFSKIPAGEPEGNTESFDMNQLPGEERALIFEHLEQMHMKWVDETIPALDNQTPREAVKTDEGKQKVISLINDWENSQLRMPNSQFEFDFNKLRRSLGLGDE